MVFELLEWDTNFFGIPTARICPPVMLPGELESTLDTLRKNGIQLVYWPSDAPVDDAIVRSWGGCLVDKKTTYLIDLKDAELCLSAAPPNVVPYDPSMDAGPFMTLAIQSGHYSRFAVDPRFPKERFEQLYRHWITQSLRKEMAKEVLAVQEQGRAVGMVTLRETEKRGDIGLIAVQSEHRGKGYGIRLVRAAQHWFLDHGYAYAQVVTQADNVPACRLYEKCGYAIEKIQFFYHFWIQESARDGGARQDQ